MLRSLIRGVLIFLGILAALALAFGALYYYNQRYKDQIWAEHQQRNEAARKAWLEAYNRRLGPLDVRNQAAAPKVRELLGAMWPVYVEAKDAPAPPCPDKLAGKVGVTYPDELKSFASGSTNEELDYDDSGYSDLYSRYLRTREDRRPPNEPPVIVQGPFNDWFSVDAEELLRLPYLAVVQTDEHTDATLQAGGQEFKGGRVTGQLYLFDPASRRLLCRAPFSATNSPEVRAQYRRTRIPDVGTRHDVEIAKKNDRAARQSLLGALESDLSRQKWAAVRQALRSISPSLEVYRPERPPAP